MHEVELWVLVDQDGNAVVSTEESDLAELYDEKVGNDARFVRRVVKVVLSVPVMTEVTLRGTVPAEGEASLSVVA